MLAIEQVQPMLDGCMSSSPAQKESLLDSAKDLAGSSRLGRKSEKKKASKPRKESESSGHLPAPPAVMGSSPPQLPAALPSPGLLTCSS